jgi:protein TonB
VALFEETLIESLRRRRPLRETGPLLLALGVHAIVLIGLLGARLWAVEDLPDPPVRVTYWLEAPTAPPPPPPPPPAPAPRAEPEETTPEVETEPEVLTQPQEVPQELPAAPEDTGVEGGVDGGVEGGVVGGTEGGVIGGQLDGTLGGVLGGVPGGIVGQPLRAGTGNIKEPRLVYKVVPAFPETARRARIQGAVILELIIDYQGSVRDIKVLRGLPEGLTESAIEAVKQWRYEPSTLDGQPIEVVFILTVRFNLL